MLVESGYYDEVANELVLVLANGSEIRIPVGNLLTDLDAHNIRFNGSGTNYLTAKTEVESAVKELDTRVKANADNVAVLNDTTAKLAVSNVFTQPQQVPNATLPQHATNKLQAETMFEMFKQQLRGYNLAMPNLTGKEYLGNGVYRLYNDNGITIDYDIYNGYVILNGTTPTGTTEINLDLYRNVVPNGSIVSFGYYYVSGTFEHDTPYATLFVNSPNLPADMGLKNGLNYTIKAVRENYEYNYNGNKLIPRIYLGVGGTITFNNFTFRVQLEKGDTATPYTVPGQIPQYKIVGEE